MSEISERDIWLANFPFAEDPSKKKMRPAGIVLKVLDEMVVIMITTKGPRKEYHDIEIKELEYSNLKQPSYARCSKVLRVTDEELEFIAKIGELHEDDYHTICYKLAELQRDSKLQYMNHIDFEAIGRDVNNT